MKRALAWLVSVSVATVIGCAGEKQPPADPNYKPATDPSALTMPDQINRPGGAPGGK